MLQKHEGTAHWKSLNLRIVSQLSTESKLEGNVDTIKDLKGKIIGTFNTNRKARRLKAKRFLKTL